MQPTKSGTINRTIKVIFAVVCSCFFVIHGFNTFSTLPRAKDRDFAAWFRRAELQLMNGSQDVSGAVSVHYTVHTPLLPEPRRMALSLDKPAVDGASGDLARREVIHRVLSLLVEGKVFQENDQCATATKSESWISDLFIKHNGTVIFRQECIVLNSISKQNLWVILNTYGKAE